MKTIFSHNEADTTNFLYSARTYDIDRSLSIYLYDPPTKTLRKDEFTYTNSKHKTKIPKLCIEQGPIDEIVERLVTAPRKACNMPSESYWNDVLYRLYIKYKYKMYCCNRLHS
jgi:hypothetical protein